MKDPDRVPDSRTLSCGFLVLDSSQPPFSFLQPTIEGLDGWIRSGQPRIQARIWMSAGAVPALPKSEIQRNWPLKAFRVEEVYRSRRFSPRPDLMSGDSSPRSETNWLQRSSLSAPICGSLT